MEKLTGNITTHFTWEEALRSEKAIQLGVKNIPNERQAKNIVYTANVMEVVRTFLGNNPTSPSSWFRCPKLNVAVGGSATSAHPDGRAIDFKCPGFGTPDEIVRHLAAQPSFMFDQLISEVDALGNTWVHLGLVVDGTGRREVLKGVPGTDGRMKYVPFS